MGIEPNQPAQWCSTVDTGCSVSHWNQCKPNLHHWWLTWQLSLDAQCEWDLTRPKWKYSVPRFGWLYRLNILYKNMGYCLGIGGLANESIHFLLAILFWFRKFLMTRHEKLKVLIRNFYQMTGYLNSYTLSFYSFEVVRWNQRTPTSSKNSNWHKQGGKRTWSFSSIDWCKWYKASATSLSHSLGVNRP